MRTMRSSLATVALVLVALVLGACGGGSSGGDPVTTGATTTNPVTAPDMPTLAPTAQSIKAFRFTWTDVSNETEYRLLESPDGTSAYTKVATIAADSTSRDLQVFLPGRVNARYLLQACNSAGCTDSSVVSVSTALTTAALTSAIGYVKASNTGTNDLFGRSVALSADGTTLAVGATDEDSNATGIDGNQADNSAGFSGAPSMSSPPAAPHGPSRPT